MSAHAYHKGGVGFWHYICELGWDPDRAGVCLNNKSTSSFFSRTYFCQTIQFVSRNMKKRNEDEPDNLGGLGDVLPAEVLKMLNEIGRASCRDRV